MDLALIKSFARLQKLLLLGEYIFDTKLRYSHNELLLTVKLKEGDIQQIKDSEINARGYE